MSEAHSITLYACPMLTVEAWCVRRHIDGQLVATHLTQAEAETIAARGMNRTTCPHCGGRGFMLDWIDQGGAMRALPAEPCERCDGAGEIPISAGFKAASGERENDR